MQQYQETFYTTALKVVYEYGRLKFYSECGRVAVPTLINYKGKNSKFFADINYSGEEYTVDLLDFELSPSNHSISFRIINDGSLYYSLTGMDIPEIIPNEIEKYEGFIRETCEYEYNKIVYRLIQAVQNEGKNITTYKYIKENEDKENKSPFDRDKDKFTIRFDYGKLQELNVENTENYPNNTKINIIRENGKLICRFLPNDDNEYDIESLCIKNKTIYYSYKGKTITRPLDLSFDVYKIVESLLNLEDIL